MDWWRAMRQVLGYEWLLLRRHRKLALAFTGLLFVPALYALIYLWGMWDPASHARDLPAGLVNLDAGARYNERDLNLGSEALLAIERHGQFAYRRLDDALEARWELVLSSTAGSQRNLQTLRTALGDLQEGATGLKAKLGLAGAGPARGA